MALPNEPITTREMYLSNIAGQNTALPDAPITREEMYLDYIAKNGGTGEGDMKKSVYDSDNSVASAGGIKMFVNSKIGTLPQRVGSLETTAGVLEGEVASIEDDLDSLGTASTKNSTSVVTESSDLVESGAVFDTLRDAQVIDKNLLDIILPNQTNYFGIDFTNNQDGTFTLNGTATGNLALRLDQISTSGTSNLKVYPDGSYTVKGASTKFDFTIMRLDGYKVIFSAGKKSEYTANITDSGDCFSYIYINSGTSFSNETFRIVFTPTPLKDVVPTKADNSVIAPVENGTTASQAYAVGSHAIRNGAFITWKNAKAQGETINDASDYTSGDVAGNIPNYKLIDNNASVNININLMNIIFIRYGSSEGDGVIYAVTATAAVKISGTANEHITLSVSNGVLTISNAIGWSVGMIII